MTDIEPPPDWPELLAELRKLTDLIAPLQAILAQEETQGLSDRIDRFLMEITRVGDQMARAVTAMEAEQETRDLTKRIVRASEAQGQDIAILKAGISRILTMLGEPLQQDTMPPSHAQR